MPSDASDLATVLRAAEGRVIGAEFARRLGDQATAARMDADAIVLYTQALSIDPRIRRGASSRTGPRLDERQRWR